MALTGKRRRADGRGLYATLAELDARFRLKLWVSLLFGVLLIAASVILKFTITDKTEKALIVQLVQSIASGAADLKSVSEFLGSLAAETNQNAILLADIVRDLGIAVVISVIVTFSIEKYSSDRLREHITYDVLSAAYSKVIPEEVYTQVADNIFRSNVFRRNWEVHINATAGALDTRRGTAIITARYSYDVENLNEHSIPFKVLASVDLDDPPPDDDVPKFTAFAVEDERNQPLVQPNDAAKLLTKPAKSIAMPDPERSGNVILERDTREMRMSADVAIRPRRSIKVTFGVERAIRVPGHYVLSAPVPADGIRIIINVHGFSLTVVPLHPDREALQKPQTDTWRFDAAILPWQSFRFTAEL
jgi:hypothetical protein